MNARGKASLIALLALIGCLAACSSGPSRTDAAVAPHRFDPTTDPYWLDPRWDKSLLDAVQSVVHDPVDAADMAPRGLRATVKFTLADGAVEYPALVAGTGNQDLDDLLLKQVASAQVPKPTGLHADEPHGFLLDLDMPTPFESFQNSIYAAIEGYKVYPKNGVVSATMGETTVDFDYLDGKASGITIVTSSNHRDLDKASLDAVTNAIMPLTPPVYADKTLHMEVIFCYVLNGIKNCPDAGNIILVQGTRAHKVGNRWQYDPAPPPDH